MVVAAAVPVGVSVVVEVEASVEEDPTTELAGGGGGAGSASEQAAASSAAASSAASRPRWARFLDKEFIASI